MRRLSTPTSHKLSESAMLAVISFWRHACAYKVHSPMLPSRRPRQSQLLVCHAASPIQPQRDVTLLIPRLSCQVDGQWRCFDEKQAAPLGGAKQDWRSSCPKSNATTTAPFEPGKPPGSQRRCFWGAQTDRPRAASAIFTPFVFLVSLGVLSLSAILGDRPGKKRALLPKEPPPP